MKSTMQKVTCIIIAITMIVVIASFEGGVRAADSSMMKGTFHYADLNTYTEELSATYCYTDDYFSNSSYVYNESLATMSLCASSAAVGSNSNSGDQYGRKYSGYSQNIEKMMKDIGFTDMYVNSDYNTKPTKDSIGVCICRKKIKVGGVDYTLIALNLRNANYEKEWINNFAIGTGTEHEGMTRAAVKARGELENYISDKSITGNVKIWITGYSRGGGIANLLGASIDKTPELGSLNLKVNNLYVYTFGAANVSGNADRNKRVYENIFNCVNPYDGLTQIAPEDWDWGRYGVDKELPCAVQDLNYQTKKDRMLKFLNILKPGTVIASEIIQTYTLSIRKDGTGQLIADFTEGEKKELSEFLRHTVSSIAEIVKNNEDYAKMQPVIEKLILLMNDATEEEKAMFMASIQKAITEEGMAAVVRDILFSKAENSANTIIQCMKDAGFEIEDENVLKDSVKVTLKNLLGIALGSEGGYTEVATLYKNFANLVPYHMNYVYLAWMESFDSNYSLSSDHIETTTETVITKPTKVKVKKAIKKRKAKKLTVTIKKISGVNGYQIAVYTTRGNARKNKKTIYKKILEKNKKKVTVSSKKLKNKKKLFVKVRAYRLNGTKKVYGAWSSVKKVKIK